jgi:hypothetical protein
MAAVGAVQVQCPECDVVMPIAMVLKSPTRRGDSLIVDVEPDLTDATAHVWTHEAPTDGEPGPDGP